MMEKRQEAAAVQKLVYIRSALRFAKRFGVRQLAAALRTNSTSYRDFTLLTD